MPDFIESPIKLNPNREASPNDLNQRAAMHWEFGSRLAIFFGICLIDLALIASMTYCMVNKVEVSSA